MAATGAVDLWTNARPRLGANPLHSPAEQVNCCVVSGNGKPKRPIEKGRNADGTFAHGYKGGPGNPWVKLTHRLKAEIVKISKEEDDEGRANIELLARQLWDMALGGPWEDDKTGAAKRWAMQTLLERIGGKAAQSVEITGDISFTVSEFYRALADRALQRS